MQYPVFVQFSGSTKEYGYLLSPSEAALVTKGDRAVVPTKMRDDGTVSLSIATITDCAPVGIPPADLEQLKPIISLLSRDRLKEVTQTCAALAAKAVTQ